MVDFTDLKWYGTTSVSGGPIDTSNQIFSATPNNLFRSIKRNEIIAGGIFYKCMYFKNTHATESMENIKIWISNGTPLDYTSISFGFDRTADPYDKAIGFDGVNDYLDCGNDTDLWSKPLTKFAFKVSFYSNISGDGNLREIVSHGGTSNQGFRFVISSSNPNNVQFIIKDSGGTNHTVSTNTHNPREKNTYICSYNATSGSDNMRIYKNGSLESTGDYTDTINLSSILTLSGATTDFAGYIYDFQFWNTDLDTDDVIELDEKGDIEDKPPAYHLDMHELTGSTTKDGVSKTKVATLTNGAFWKTNAQTTSSEFNEPDVREWLGSGDIPDAIERMGPGTAWPIWVRLTIDGQTTADQVLNDSGIFTIKFDITATGTPTDPGNPGGTPGTPPPSTNWKMAIAGDWGTETETEDVVDMMKGQNYDFILGTGDNGYKDDSGWMSLFKPFKDKMESAFGNHEYDDGVSNYKNFFGYSKTYNSFRFQNVLIITIDSNSDESFPGWTTQRDWMKNELEKYKADSRVYWRIVAMHHPWFGHGGNHTPNEFGQVEKLMKLCLDYDVNFVVTGHNHNWQRTHQVAYNSGSAEDPIVVDSSSPYDKDNNGLIAIVSGTGGHDSGGKLYDLPGSESYFAYLNKSHNGVFELVASNSGKTLTGRFRDIDNKTFSQFTIE